MAFSMDVTLIGTGTQTELYSQVSLENSKAIRRNPERDLGTPHVFTISHEEKGKNMEAVDRHLVRLDWKELDSGDPANAVLIASVYFVIIKPRRIITEADITEMVTQICNFLLDPANLIKILNSEP